MIVKGTRDENIDDGEVKEVEAVVPKASRKCRRQATVEIEEEEKCSKILDVDEMIEELKREARVKEEKDDALVVEGAVRVLFGMERLDRATAKRLLEKILRVLKEVEEEKTEDK